jgi:hypothetical protein
MHSTKRNAVILMACSVLALVLIAPVITHGDEWNLATRFKVNQPFEVPGLALQPNTPYVMRLLDSPAERHVVEIYNTDETKMLTRFMAVSDERQQVADKTVFTFIETEPGFPLPMKEWFYPGRLIGLEFIYPKHQAREIAHHAKEAVLSTDSVDLHDLASLKVEAIEPIGSEAAITSTATNFTKLETPTIVEEKPSAPAVEEKNATPEVVQAAPAVQEPEAPAIQEPEVQQSTPVVQNNTETTTTTTDQQQTTQTSQEKRELPRTAGELPLIGLAGALLLGAGLGMRVLSSKS